MRPRAVGCAMAIAMAFGQGPALAQDAPPRAHALDVAAGVVWLGGASLGTSTGSLTGNDPGGPAYPLFSTSTRVDAGSGLGGRVGFSLTRTVSVEGTVSWVPGTWTTHVSGDVEGAPDLDATTHADTVAVGGALLLHLRRLTFASGRGLPFVVAGVAYLRQVDDAGVLLATGRAVDAAGGVKYALARRDRGLVRSVGVRGAIGITSRSGEFDPTGRDRRRTTWTASAGLFLGF
jgi:hypothetical protein